MNTKTLKDNHILRTNSSINLQFVDIRLLVYYNVDYRLEYIGDVYLSRVPNLAHFIDIRFKFFSRCAHKKIWPIVLFYVIVCSVFFHSVNKGIIKTTFQS